MSDTNEEQLLSDLLRGIAREDARLEAAHLEGRVMSAYEMVRLKPDTTYFMKATHYMKAAAIVIAVLVPGVLWLARNKPIYTTEVNVEPAHEAVAETQVTLAPPSSRTRPA